jgi:hypothetical protein
VALRNIQAVVEDMRDNSRDVEKTSQFLHRNESRQYPAASTVCNHDKAKQSCVLEQRPRATSTAKAGDSLVYHPMCGSVAQDEARNDSWGSKSLRGRKVDLSRIGQLAQSGRTSIWSNPGGPTCPLDSVHHSIAPEPWKLSALNRRQPSRVHWGALTL